MSLIAENSMQIDVNNSSINNAVAVQGDHIGRKIKITLLSQGEVVDLSNCTATVKCSANGKTIAANSCDINANVVTVELTKTMLAYTGKIKMQVSVTDSGGAVISTPIIYLIVSESISTTPVEETPDFSILADLTGRIMAVLNDPAVGDTEVKDARGGYTVLGDRLKAVDKATAEIISTLGKHTHTKNIYTAANWSLYNGITMTPHSDGGYVSFNGTAGANAQTFLLSLDKAIKLDSNKATFALAKIRLRAVGADVTVSFRDDAFFNSTNVIATNSQTITDTWITDKLTDGEWRTIWVVTGGDKTITKLGVQPLPTTSDYELQVSSVDCYYSGDGAEVADIITRLAAAEGNISSLQKSVKANADNITSLQTTTSENTANISDLQTTVNGSASTSGTVKNQIAIAKTEVVEESVNPLAERVTAAEKKVTANETNISELKSDLLNKEKLIGSYIEFDLAGVPGSYSFSTKKFTVIPNKKYVLTISNWYTDNKLGILIQVSGGSISSAKKMSSYTIDTTSDTLTIQMKIDADTIAHCVLACEDASIPNKINEITDEVNKLEEKQHIFNITGVSGEYIFSNHTLKVFPNEEYYLRLNNFDTTGKSGAIIQVTGGKVKVVKEKEEYIITTSNDTLIIQLKVAENSVCNCMLQNYSLIRELSDREKSNDELTRSMIAETYWQNSIVISDVEHDYYAHESQMTIDKNGNCYVVYTYDENPSEDVHPETSVTRGIKLSVFNVATPHVREIYTVYSHGEIINDIETIQSTIAYVNVVNDIARINFYAGYNGTDGTKRGMMCYVDFDIDTKSFNEKRVCNMKIKQNNTVVPMIAGNQNEHAEWLYNNGYIDTNDASFGLAGGGDIHLIDDYYYTTTYSSMNGKETNGFMRTSDFIEWELLGIQNNVLNEEPVLVKEGSIIKVGQSFRTISRTEIGYPVCCDSSDLLTFGSISKVNCGSVSSAKPSVIGSDFGVIMLDMCNVKSYNGSYKSSRLCLGVYRIYNSGTGIKLYDVNMVVGVHTPYMFVHRNSIYCVFTSNAQKITQGDGAGCSAIHFLKLPERFMDYTQY